MPERPEDVARMIIDTSRYMVLATADPTGRLHVGSR